MNQTKIISTFHLIQKQYETMEENPILNYHDKIIELEKEMLKKSDKVILLTKSQFDLIIKGYGEFDIKKIIIVPLGMYFCQQTFSELLKKKLSNKYLDITFVGRIERDKGIFELLAAFSKLSKKYKKIRLNILGKGSRLKLLKNKYKRKNILFYGFVDRKILEGVLKKSFVFCLPSYSESFGISVMEAMSFGAVPVFSKGESVPELYKENVDGLKIPLILKEGRYVPIIDDIFNRLELLINNKKLLIKFSRNVYNLVRTNYAMNDIVKKILIVYKGALD